MSILSNSARSELVELLTNRLFVELDNLGAPQPVIDLLHGIDLLSNSPSHEATHICLEALQRTGGI